VQSAPPRSFRPPVTDEPWVAPEPAPVREPNLRARPADSITNMAAEFNARLSPELDLPAPPPPPRPAPMSPPRDVAPPPPPAPPPQLPPQTDRNLAEMAQRLEAALRRPGSPQDAHPPVTDPLAAPLPPRDLPEPPIREPRAEPPMREPRIEPESRPEPRLEPKPDTKPATAKNPFDSLEEEMASLLGRQPGKT
jgi:hypothetical protein